ncbi:MAG TPA: diacylglycerol kinase family protein [Methylovirgula sp.]|nr:diacylglycerol kinase family protein [Methylovirgula sp.]
MGKTIRRVAVVVNCKAGALFDCDNAEEKLRDAFTRAGLEPSFIADASSLPERLAQAAKLGPDAVVVAGGDGTVACAASVLINSDTPLAILPCGTMNLLAKDLALPIDDLPAAIALISAGQLREVDVGEVNGSVFLCASMLGLPARLGRTREESRGSIWRTSARMARAVQRHLLRTHHLRAILTADGSVIPARAAALTITVNPIDHTSGRSFGRTKLSGGRFGIYILDSFGLRELLALGMRVTFGRRDTAVREYEAREVNITGRSRAIWVMNDGELSLLTPPLRYRLQPRALRVVVPAT